MSLSAGPSPLGVLTQVQEAVTLLQQALQDVVPDKLEPALLQMQQALHELSQYPGGFDALSRDVDALPAAQSQQARDLLERARSDHQVNAGLLQLAMQRNAALQSYVAQESTAATYGSGGGVQSGLGGQLLGKY